MADMEKVFEAIGSIRSTVEAVREEQSHARQRDEKVFAKLETLGTSSAVNAQKHEQLVQRVADMEPHVESYKNVRQRGLALWAASVFVAGFIGPALGTVKAWWGKG